MHLVSLICLAALAAAPLHGNRVMRRVRVIGAPEASLEVAMNEGNFTRAATDGGVALITVTLPATLTARAPGLIGIALIDENGARDVEVGLHPIARVELDVPREASVQLGAWRSAPLARPDPPVVELPAGTHRFQAETFTDALTDWVTLDAGTQRLAVRLPHPMFHGRVFKRDGGGPVTGAGVMFESDQLAGCGMDEGACGPVRPYSALTQTDDVGNFSIMVLDPGDYRVLAWGPDAGILRTTVRVPAKNLTLWLTPGQSVDVHAKTGSSVGAWPTDSRGIGHPKLREAPVVNGVAHFDGLSGRVWFFGSDDRSVSIDLADAGPDVFLEPERAPERWSGEASKPWKPPKPPPRPRAVDPKGRPVPGVSDHANKFEAPGFVPTAYDARAEPPSRTVVMRPLPVRGRAPAGAAIAFLCAQDSQRDGLRWSRHITDVGPSIQWRLWPGGMQCVAATVQAAPDGTFCLDSLPSSAKPIIAVEARLGDRVQRLPFTADAGLVFDLEPR